MKVRVKILQYRSREGTQLRRLCLRSSHVAARHDASGFTMVDSRRGRIQLGIPAKAIDSIKCTLLWVKFAFFLFITIIILGYFVKMSRCDKRVFDELRLSEPSLVNMIQSFSLLIHVAINTHLILIWLNFVLNAGLRMNYNHLEG